MTYRRLIIESWFSVENVDKSTFVISEYKHWEQVHSYLVIGNQKAALIDTGLGVGNIKNVVLQLTSLPIQIVTTHVHWDHIGGHRHFDTISVHQDDVKWLSDRFPIPLQVVKNNLLKEPCDFPKEFDINSYIVFQGKPSVILQDNDVIDLGNRKLQVIHTPGHSPGHICLYERYTGYLFSGDLIYKGTLDAFYPSTSPTDFMDSVRKVQAMPIKKILPAHYSLDVPVSMIKEISGAFSEIKGRGNLIQGKGVFKFKNFNIHI